ncbi:hypothetical protein [Sphingomonas bacterium]|uniref:hypothetical protein n=1 Tax=Sphingomonas bacterium TaxID=1895847 RepID=UPI0015773934|nr:hypothetical protein [Sphingomonas bacterium]
MIDVAPFVIVAGVTLVRIGWTGRLVVAVAGWALIAVALTACTRDTGAWGLAVGTVAGMAAAFATLLWSGWATPVRTWRPDRERVAAISGEGSLALMRRASVFLVVVPGGGLVSLLLAFGLQAAGRRAGVGEADAAACLLLSLPVIWASLLAWQMTRDGLRQMIVPLFLLAAVGSFLGMAR